MAECGLGHTLWGHSLSLLLAVLKRLWQRTVPVYNGSSKSSHDQHQAWLAAFLDPLGMAPLDPLFCGVWVLSKLLNDLQMPPPLDGVTLGPSGIDVLTSGSGSMRALDSLLALYQLLGPEDFGLSGGCLEDHWFCGLCMVAAKLWP